MRPLSQAWRIAAASRLVRVWLPAGTVASALIITALTPQTRATFCTFFEQEMAICGR